MSELSDRGIEVLESDDGVSYELPLRPLARYRFLRLVLILVGVLFAITPPIILIAFGRPAAAQRLLPWEYAVRCLPFVIFFLLAGLVLIGFVLVFMAGRTRIEITATQLISFERVGTWVLTTSRRPLQRLQRFKVVQLWPNKKGKPFIDGSRAELVGLWAEFESAKPLPMALGYPRSWLRLIAEDMSRRLPQAADMLNAEAEPSEARVVDEVGQELEQEDHAEQPADSLIVVEQQPNSLVLKIPPAGPWRGLKGLVYYALFWGGILIIFTGFEWMLFGKRIPVVASIVFIWAAFIASLLGATNMRRRRTVLAVVDGTLMIYQRGLFRAKRHEWPVGEVKVRTGPSGMTANDVPILELQIHAKNGAKVGLLAGRDVEELRWLAKVLRRNLVAEHLGSGTEQG